jgi:DNA-binding LacI/PurR family transcriptional regulator
VCRIDPTDRETVRGIIDELDPDGIVCANDLTAAQLMQTLQALGLPPPDHIRMAGIDDVKYASLLPVPLTTIHQPCNAIGTTAVAAMLQRLRNPRMPARDFLLDFELVVRESCNRS